MPRCAPGQPELLVVVAYGLILPRAVLELPRLGCLNIHASLLPRWRGAAPIQRAILAGDAETGVTIMRWTQASTPGRSCAAARCRSARRRPAASCMTRLAPLGAGLLLAVIDAIWRRARAAAAATAREPA